MIDDHTWFSWLFQLYLKFDCLNAFVNFCSMVSLAFPFPLSMVQCYGRGEFTSTAFINFCNTSGIHLCCRTQTPTCFLNHSNVPAKFWVYALQSATFLINCLPSPVTNNRSPYEMLYDRFLDYSLLKTNGCCCYLSYLNTRGQNSIQPLQDTTSSSIHPFICQSQYSHPTNCFVMTCPIW